MSADDPKNADKNSAKKKKGGLIRADAAGGLDRDEESVVDWVDDDPGPSESGSADTAETGTEEAAALPADSVFEPPPPEPEPETPQPLPTDEPEEVVAEAAAPPTARRATDA